MDRQDPRAELDRRSLMAGLIGAAALAGSARAMAQATGVSPRANICHCGPTSS